MADKLYVYKVRAVVIYKKDEKKNDTKEIELIYPAASVPFVGDVDDANEWYVIKTPVKLEESEEVIKIDVEKSEKFNLVNRVSIDKVKGWGYGGKQ